ncbi:MAG: translation initiation factor IF-2, translation initiation factor IF-2 [Candidatus Peregrinibacteria bacterium GW2011_GWF2_38_29]|nr:MAG: translation initiation factor IF-2, translation initiation factor IF-2 [Candidatus Peregrinibacteria bacterium GW2011_GWF2_38_29]HBB02904.1 translation initiation factor IF-2 [Candidatus Peregrinibacteria bacterium]
MSVKIADLAEKLGLTSAELKKKMKESGFDIKPQTRVIDEETAGLFESGFGKNAEAKTEKKAGKKIEKEAEKIEKKVEAEPVAEIVEEKEPEKVEEVYEEIIDEQLDREIIKAQRKMTAGKDIRSKKPEKPVYQQPVAAPQIVDGSIEIPDVISVKEFAEKTGLPVAKVIGELMRNGILANINQQLDFETAQIIADDLKILLKRKRTSASAADIMEGNLSSLLKEDNSSDMKVRPPIVVVMGHVDHGKTKLLDKIRSTKVVEGEAGGITQKIGAYQVEHKGRKITFLDTPGHEAFTAMRARGAKVTDIAILVVASDEGIKPQTIEALNHAKEAEVPIIVALNKIDKPEANPEMVKGQLSEYGLIPEEWGGKTIMVPVSAITGQGVDTILEMVLLVADMENLRANANREAVGTVIESHLDKSFGPVASIVVNTGTLKIGDNVVIGSVFGKVKAMKDWSGKNIVSAGPSMPASIAGLSKTPQSGDILHTLPDEKTARERAMQVENLLKSKSMASGLGNIISQIKSGALKTLKIVLKADTKGSLEALKESLGKIHNDEVALKIIHGAIGNITESDVVMAGASQGIVIGFNTIVSSHVARVAEIHGVEIATYNIIYKLIEDIQGILTGMLEPEIIETVLGQAQVLQVFFNKKQTTIAGCKVIKDVVKNKAKLRVIRDGKVIGAGEIQSLKKVSEAVNELGEGQECGIKYFGEVILQVDDILEAYVTERRKKELKLT